MSKDNKTSNIKEEDICCKPRIGGNCYNCNSYSLTPYFEVERYRNTAEERDGIYSVYCPSCGSKNSIDERIYENYIDIYNQVKHLDHIKEEIFSSLRFNFNRDFIAKKIKLLETDLEFTLAEVSLSGGLHSKLQRVKVEANALHWFIHFLSDIDAGEHGDVEEKRVSSKIKKYSFF